MSIGDNANFERITDFAVNVVNAVESQGIDARYAVILFARHAWIRFKISDDIANVTEAITSIKYTTSVSKEIDHEGTNIPEALDLLREAGKDERLGLRDDSDYKCVIFVTDGRSNTAKLVAKQQGMETSGSAYKAFKYKQLEKDTNNTKANAKKLHDSGVYDQIFAIGIKAKKDIDTEELRYIDTANNPIVVEGFNETEFSIALEQIHFCNREYKPSMYM